MQEPKAVSELLRSALKKKADYDRPPIDFAYRDSDELTDAAADKLLSDGGFPVLYRGATWDRVGCRSVVEQYLAEDWLAPSSRKRGLVVEGATGVGKTSLLFLLALAIVRTYRTRPKFVSLGRLFDLYFERSFELLRTFETSPVLFIDDFARVYGTEYPVARFETFFEHRYANLLPTFVSTDVRIEELRDRTGFERVADRLNDPTFVARLTYAGASQRERG